MIDNEAASRIRQDIEKLVTSYKAHKKSKNDDAKEMAAISEANVRADFIDGLFEILGWNIRDILRKRLDFSVLKDKKGIFDIEKLKSAVQRILDRLIIIRWAEDHLLLDDSNILGDKLKLWKSAGRYNPLYEALFQRVRTRISEI